MKETKRFMMVIVGSYTGIEDEMKFLADKRGTNHIHGNQMFFATFYSPLDIDALYLQLGHRPAIMLFDVTTQHTYAVNLPQKYFEALFPEDKEVRDILKGMDLGDMEPPKPTKRPRKTKTIRKPKKEVTVDFVLDKLKENNYDKTCLNDTELKIMEEWSDQ